MKPYLTAALIPLMLAMSAGSVAAQSSEPTLFADISPIEASNVMPEQSLSNIAVARVDGGRLIPTPYDEVRDWQFLDKRIGAKVSQLRNYTHYIPELYWGEAGSENKIDEIRLTAANEGFDHVLIYGVGPDASWASFGGKALSETGLRVHEDCASWETAKSKALLINSYTGEVLGAVTSDDIEYNIGDLADQVEGLIRDLSSETLKI